MSEQQERRRLRRRRPGRVVLVILVALASVWLAGNLLLEVQLPEPPDPREMSLSVAARAPLREIFAALPAEGGGDTDLTLLDDNTAAWVERWRLLANARERLDVSYFILKRDIFGLAFLGHLAHKGRQGVRVRVLLDAMGTRMSRQLSANYYLDTLVEADNVAVKVYRPLFYRYLDTFLTLNPAAIVASDHGKILLADDLRGMIGGRNIAAEYFAALSSDPRAFRDADVLLEGPAIGTALRRVFEVQFEGGEAHDVTDARIHFKDAADELELAYLAMDSWLRGAGVPAQIAAAIRERELPWLDDLQALPELRGALRTPPAESIRAPARLLESRIRLLDAGDRITRSLIHLVGGARESIFILNPYLVLPRAAVELLADAASRGAQITVLTNSPSSTDLPLSQAFFAEQWPELLARVPGLRLFVAGDLHNLHGKLAVIDGELGLIGTYNLEPMSMTINSELVVAVWSAPFAERLLDLPQQLIAAGPPQTYEYRIARDEAGQALRDKNGRVIVAFGPKDHSSPEHWAAVERHRALARLIQSLPGVDLLQ
jgi:cardiolipin synthase C